MPALLQEMLDEKVAKLHIPALNAELTVVAQDQAVSYRCQSWALAEPRRQYRVHSVELTMCQQIPVGSRPTRTTSSSFRRKLDKKVASVELGCGTTPDREELCEIERVRPATFG